MLMKLNDRNPWNLVNQIDLMEVQVKKHQQYLNKWKDVVEEI